MEAEEAGWAVKITVKTLTWRELVQLRFLASDELRRRRRRAKRRGKRR
jgi:hypothetical protein